MKRKAFLLKPRNSKMKNMNSRTSPINKRKKTRSHSYRFIRVPGYLIEAKFNYSPHHPHSIWWMSYILAILQGASIYDLIKDPPWPCPNNGIIVRQLIYELLDNDLIEINWKTGKVKVKNDLRKEHKERSVAGIIGTLLKHETIKGEWWVEALSGRILSRETAFSYDIDFSREIPRNCLIIKTLISEDQIEDHVNLNVSQIIPFLQFGGRQNLGIIKRNIKNNLFLGEPIRVKTKKEIQFELYGDSSPDSLRLIPNRLRELEPVLQEFVPEIFGKKKRHRHSKKQIYRSNIEKFALKLKEFPIQFDFQITQPRIYYLCQYLLEKLEPKEEWIKWFVEGHYIEPIVGNADLHFECLTEMLTGNWQVLPDLMESTRTKPPEINITLTSFLNLNNLQENGGLLKVLADLNEINPNSIFLLIYGHANDDAFEQQILDIQKYKNKILSFLPDFKDKLFIVTAKQRSHEKIIVCSNGAWLLGSWNVGSSRPSSKLFEASVRGYSYSLSRKLLERIEDLIEEPIAKELIRKCKNILIMKQMEENRNVKNMKKTADFLYENLKKSIQDFTQFSDLLKISSDPDRISETYQLGLNLIRICLLPFLKRARIRLSDERNSRDLLINQTRKSSSDIFLASDRISRDALDSAFIQDFLYHSPEDKKTLRILWGREWEEERIEDKIVLMQLKEARITIEALKKHLNEQLLTNTHPMENHSKFALFDGSRGLITSENILSYGGEKDKYESRELGIFIESIPLIRYIQGRALFHRLPYFHPTLQNSSTAFRPYEWITEGSNQFYAFFQIQEDIPYNFRELKYINSAILYEIDPSSHYENDDFDEFDEMLLQQKKSCLSERQELISGPFIDHIWQEGICYYLLTPNLKRYWIPYDLQIQKEQIEELKAAFYKRFEILQVEKAIKKDDFTAPDKNAQIQEEKEIVEEIMKDMVLIRKGRFYMGDDRVPDERPRHEVIISRDFYLGKYPVTQKIWKKVMRSLPPLKPNEINDNFPIIHVSYNDAQEFLKKLNSFPGSGNFDLPTEAQWEYACRAGSNGDYCFGSDPGFGRDPGKLEEYAWTKRNSNRSLHEIGLLKTNKWGLHDMHGLVYEHLKDDKRVYGKKSVVDPIGPTNTNKVGTRGGCWSRFPIDGRRDLRREHFRCSCRTDHPKDEKSYRTSFRLVRNKNDYRKKAKFKGI